MLGFGQWRRFGSERDFYRYATTQLRDAFPGVARPQPVQPPRPALLRFASCLLGLPDRLAPGTGRNLSSPGQHRRPTRAAKRRGKRWLPDQANIGCSNRLGWSVGFHLLLATGPAGCITGFSFAPASAKDRTRAEDFFAFRRHPHPRLLTLGAHCPWYVADKGFTGRAAHQRWRRQYQAWVVAPPQTSLELSPSP